METVFLVVVILVVAVLFILGIYNLAEQKFKRRFRQWQEAEESRFEEERGRVSKVAIAQSRAVLGGKFTEQMAPYFPEFKYDPTEARFIGSPIDLIVFPGLSEGDPREIVIIEVKSSQKVNLTPQEKKIRQLIEDGMVRWELLQKSVEGEG
jgi:predicted Holliday junction resolvase-like endonuclease